MKFNIANRYFIICLLIAFAFPLFLNAQSNNSISGVVIDEMTNLPIKNVNTFLAYTMIGTTSDYEGRFEIKNVPQGNYEIIFSHVNYKKFNSSIKVINNKPLTFSVKLTPKIYELDLIPVVSDIDEWRDNLDVFKERLIGTSSFAEEVELLNPEIIDFSRNEEGNLIASAAKPLKLINNALGYRITYYLEYFEADAVNTKYSGIPVFEEIETEDESLKEDWIENRNRAYNGSLRHFLALICSNYDSTYFYKQKADSLISLQSFNKKELEYYTDKFEYFNQSNFINESGFRIINKTSLSEKYIKQVLFTINLNEYLSYAELNSEMYFKFPNFLWIQYDKEKVDYRFRPLGNREVAEYPVSAIQLGTDSVIIDKKGRYSERFMIRSYGYWAFERLAETVPYEFEPSFSK